MHALADSGMMARAAFPKRAAGERTPALPRSHMTMQEKKTDALPATRATWREWCGLACTGSVVRRGLKFAVVVGTILIVINHGDAILSGQLSASNYVKMGLTVIVPYVVSVLSSVGAIVAGGREAG